MNIREYNNGFSCRMLFFSAVTAFVLCGCASKPTKPEGVENVRQKLTQLQTDPKLGVHAQIAFKEAEDAVQAAEEPREESDDETSQHLVFMADRKVEIARALAQREYLEEEREKLDEQRLSVRLHAREKELQSALQQLKDLNARSTERGLVLTLGDVLFSSGKAVLKPGAANNLSKLVSYLQQNANSAVTIEGHTDSVGNEDFNMNLSQQRAVAVKEYLVSQGIEAQRINTAGKGEGFPVASNNTNAGRQLNRRVEVIITETAAANK